MANKTVFISATGTGAGKTYTTLALAHVLSAKGARVACMKPVETGVQTVPQDGFKLWEATRSLNSHAQNISAKTVCPVMFELAAAPAVSRGSVAMEFDKIDDAFEKLSAVCDILLIEGAGGLLTPLDERLFMVDFAARYGAKTLLVSHASLGMINDLLLSLSLLNSLALNHVWCVNPRNGDDFERVSLPYLSGHFAQILRVDTDMDKIADLVVYS